MKTNQIKNWKEFVNSVGLERAKIISQKLRYTKPIEGQNGFLFVDFDSAITEAQCIFEPVSENETTIYYEFTGTAN